MNNLANGKVLEKPEPKVVKPAPKKISSPLIRWGIVGGLLFILTLIIYLFYAASHETTDDAYTTGNVHMISSRVEGTVQEVLVNDNQPVHQGQILARLDPRDFQVKVDQARARYERALADFNRVDALKENIAISKLDYDQAREALLVTKSLLDDAVNQLSYCNIVAPADGIIGNRTVRSGNRVAVGTILMSVVDGVWVVANFKETQIQHMRPGQTVQIKIDAVSGHSFSGIIDSFSPASGATFALLPPENATGNFTKIVQRIPVKILFLPEDLKGYENVVIPGISAITTVDLTSSAGHGKRS